jgi:septal ring factor EnvC (AmiA/AmiB activator)
MPALRLIVSRLPLVALVAVAVVATLSVPAIAGSDEERRLGQARERLSQVRAEIEAAREQRQTDAARLQEAERQLAEVVEAVTEAEQAVARQQERVEDARRRLAELEDTQRRHSVVMANRAAELYRRGTAVPLTAVLSAGSSEEALERSTFVEIVSRADLAGFEELEISQVAVNAQRAELEAEEAALQRALEQQEIILAEVRELRDERALVLAGSEEQLAELEVQERHLESESRELAALARRASQERAARARQAAALEAQQQQQEEQQSTGGGGPSGTASAAPAVASGGGGGWGWPASGPITSGYGMRWGRMHEGIDIGAPTGAPVVAARGGTVSFAGRMGGYGNLVLIDHGGGQTSAYAHLSAFAVGAGQQVGQGQRIGSVGCTGSCTGPHLHFEIRINGSAQNPRGYLP